MSQLRSTSVNNNSVLCIDFLFPFVLCSIATFKIDVSLLSTIGLKLELMVVAAISRYIVTTTNYYYYHYSSPATTRSPTNRGPQAAAHRQEEITALGCLRDCTRFFKTH